MLIFVISFHVSLMTCSDRRLKALICKGCGYRAALAETGAALLVDHRANSAEEARGAILELLFVVVKYHLFRILCFFLHFC
jgi:hypothetical protein